MKHCALITGASKGIGKAMAIELARQGHDVLAVARTEPLLKELCTQLRSEFGVQARYLALDLLAPDFDAQVVDWVQVNNFPVSVLINNAGYGLWGRFEKISLEDQRRMMRLNMDSMVTLCSAMLPVLGAHKQAHILNVGSTAAYQAVPTFSVYAGSKAFVVSFSRGLAYELRKSNISVTCLSPGPTKSEFTNRAGMQKMQHVADKFNMPSAAVAKTALKAMWKGRTEVVPGFVNKMQVMAAKFLPKRLIEKMAANLYEKHLD